MMEFIVAGAATPVIDKTYPLAEITDPMRYVKSGHIRREIAISG